MPTQIRIVRLAGPLAKAVLFALLLVATLAGCDSADVTANDVNANDESVIVRNMEVSFEGKLLAQRGSARTSHELFDARMAQMPAGERAGFVSDPGRIGMILDELLMGNAIVDDALSNGMLDDPEIQARLYLAISQQIVREAREFVRQQSDLSDYEPRAREIYLADPEKYMAEPVFSFTQVLVDDEENGESRALELLELHRGGTPLESLAIEYSDDPSVESNKGILKDVDASRLDGDFLAGLESMEVGDVNVVETRYGWHIVRLDEHTPERVKSFEEVANTLKRVARSRHIENAWERYLRKHSEGELEIAPGAVAEILERYPVELSPEPADNKDAP